MMGRLKSDQGQLFYEFRLGDAVPEDHLVRKIDTALDLSWLRSELAPHYSSTGRPSIDPELMIRMLIVGYVFAIRSERLICREVQVNLAYPWFCKLGIEDAVPDHSAFSRARNERFREADVFRRVFERVVEACIASGLVGGEGFAVDASLIQADANKQRSIAGQDWRRNRDPARSSRAVREYLATLDDTAWGAASDVVPKFVSPSDPAAQWTGAHKGPAFFAYSDNYLIDVKFGVIVDVEAPRAIRQAEVGAARTMIERTEERFGLKPERLVADTAYGAAPMLNWLVETKGIAPHIPVFDKSKRDDGTFSRGDFRYDPASDVYHCPGGKQLGTSGTVHEGKTLLYRASKLDCDVCPLKPQCCPKEPSRKIPRDIHEHARDVARSFAGTEGFEQSRRERKKIEMRFAHLKRILRLGRLRLRGPRGAQHEFVMAAIAQNLRRLASLVARPPPARAMCVTTSSKDSEANEDSIPDIRKFKMRIGRLNDWWGAKTLSEIDGEQCRMYARDRGNKGGARRHLEDLRAAVNHHSAEGYHRGLVKVTLPEKGRPRDAWFTRDEAARLVDVCLHYREVQTLSRGPQKGQPIETSKRPLAHLARFILIGLYTGSRAAAIAAASPVPASGRAYVDLERGLYYRLKRGDVETNKRQPTVPLPRRLLAHLRRWHRLDPNAQHFVEFNGRPVSSVKTAFKTAVSLAGITKRVSPHTLRHTAATWLMQRGADPWQAAGYLGMSLDVLLNTYGHHHPDYLSDAVNKITSRETKAERTENVSGAVTKFPSVRR